MKKTYLSLLFTFIFLGTLFAQKDAAQPAGELFKPSVLIELFSSEGCGSCPIADDFMREIIEISDSNKMPVYVLDYHVVIWNRSGWVDPFSDSAYSLRQQNYVFKKHLPALYTPMAFINGSEKDYAGSDKKSIGMKIQETLSKPSKHFMRCGVTPAENEDSIVVGYKIWGNIDSTNLNVVLVQKRINNMVTAGENKDKILHHHNVARKMISIPLKEKQGIVKMGIKRDFNLENFRLLVFIQHQRTYEVFTTDQLSFD